MQDWLFELAHSAPMMPYVVVFGVLLLSGIGLPVPEDIPLIIGGYFCGKELADPWIMFPGSVLCIIGADTLLFLLGRRYGHHIPRLPLIRRVLHPRRLRWAEHKLAEHGGKFIFIARFLPGMRAAAFFAAGVFRVPTWKFLAYDGSAAVLSVPLIVGLAYYFADEIHLARQWIEKAEVWTLIGVLALVAVAILIKNVLKSRLFSSKPAAGWPVANDDTKVEP